MNTPIFNNMKVFTKYFLLFFLLFAAGNFAYPKPDIPPLIGFYHPPLYILGNGRISAEKMVSFLLSNNTEADREFVSSLIELYIEESVLEDVNHDIAFAQMCLETGFLAYGGLVTPEMNNFCGLGAIGPGEIGLSFPDPRTGVRAHIQHLKAYATSAPLNLELVDPRYRFVRLGHFPTVLGLAGTWAADRAYSEKIALILRRLYEFD